MSIVKSLTYSFTYHLNLSSNQCSQITNFYKIMEQENLITECFSEQIFATL